MGELIGVLLCVLVYLTTRLASGSYQRRAPYQANNQDNIHVDRRASGSYHRRAVHPSHYLNEHVDEECEERLNLPYMKALILSLSTQTVHHQRIQCKLDVFVQPTTDITEPKFDVAISVGDECQDQLDIFDGETKDRPLAGYEGLCQTRPSPSYFTNTNYLSMVFNISARAAIVTHKDNFRIIVTPSHEGVCEVGETRCHNDRCILAQYLCDGHNNCGDDSDEVGCAVIDPTTMEPAQPVQDVDAANENDDNNNEIEEPVEFESEDYEEWENDVGENQEETNGELETEGKYKAHHHTGHHGHHDVVARTIAFVCACLLVLVLGAFLAGAVFFKCPSLTARFRQTSKKAPATR